jgi:peroxiredoxin
LPSTIESLYREFRPQGLEVWAISSREPRDRVAAWLREHPLSVPVLLDGGGSVALAYRAIATPTFVLVDRTGQLVGRGVGSREWTDERGRALIRTLLGSGGR